jgi:hypothetical protein
MSIDSSLTPDLQKKVVPAADKPKKPRRKSNVPPSYRKEGTLLDEEIAPVLEAFNGLHTRAAKYLGLSRSYISHRVMESKMLQDTIKQCREALVDEAQNALREMILSLKCPAAVIYTLKTLGRDRGFAEDNPKNEYDTKALVALTQMFNASKQNDIVIEDKEIAKNDDL